MKRLIPLLCVFAMCVCTSCRADKEHTCTLFAMDTVMDLTIYGGSGELLDAAAGKITELEGLLSATDPESEIYALNSTGSADISQDTFDLLSFALKMCEETEGNLDISLYPIVKAWGFTTGEYSVPEESEILSLLENVDYRRISLHENDASVPEGMMVDLGSVAKGYAGDVLSAFLKENGVNSAILNLGGNVQTVGSKPDGSDWRIAVRSPEGDGYLGVAAVSDKAVITSGGYERYFQDGSGNVYWHIMSPKTGYPAKSGLVSVTVIGDEGKYCDALSTALFVMGEEAAEKFWREKQDFDMLLVTQDGKLIMTPGISGSFQPAQDLNYELSVIEQVK